MTQTAIHRLPDTVTAEPPASPQPGGPGWARILISGLALWSATVLFTFATGSANLVPTIILLGSFLVPVAFVTYAFDHADAVVTARRIFTAFIYGGVLGVLGASVLEAASCGSPPGPPTSASG